MILRAGLISVTLAVLLATGMALVVSLRAEAPATQEAQAEPVSSETAARKPEPKLGEKLEIDDEPSDEPSEKPRRAEARPRPSTVAPREEVPAPTGGEPAPRQGGSSERLPISNASWPAPTSGELVSVAQPRYYQPASGTEMTLTIEALGLYDVPVFSSFNEQSLEQGVMHVPDTAYPWDRGSQKNVFLAAHNLGWPGTTSRLLFYNLDQLRSGDRVILWDREGRGYQYRVSDLFVVGPEDAWVADTLIGRDILTLQTCTPYPTFEKRLIVRADRA